MIIPKHSIESLSARDHIAVAAMQGWLASFGPGDPAEPTKIAQDAYAFADAMIAHSQHSHISGNVKTERRLWLAKFDCEDHVEYHVFMGAEHEAQAEAEEVARARGIKYDWLDTETRLEDL